jgi:hypothetical protein|tara:strand:- start:6877 stop:7188 length:312 start_codon:yes stop_codon:yes gene_type:complete
MRESIKDAIKGVYYEIAGKRLQAIADLSILTEMTVGVGDHVDICKDILKKYQEIDKFNSLLDTINEVHGEITMGSTGEPAASKDTVDIKDEEECCTDGSCDCS